MSIRLLLLAAVIYFAPKNVFAKSSPEERAPTAASAEEREIEAENIVHRQSLAVHMGLSSQDVVFGKPRNFRSEGLNNFELEPISDEEQ